MTPIVEKIADEYQEKLKVGKLNVEEVFAIAEQYDVMSVYFHFNDYL